jgi:hypothetical protein
MHGAEAGGRLLLAARDSRVRLLNSDLVKDLAELGFENANLWA